jgi:hypothetical protein
MVTQLAEQLGVQPARRSELRLIIRHGHERVVEMVRAKHVGLQSASYYVQATPLAEQATATPREVKRIGTALVPGKTVGGVQARGQERPDDAAKREARKLRAERREQALMRTSMRTAPPPPTGEEFNRPPGGLANLPYPDASDGRTYAHVHREIYGAWGYDVAKRRQQIVTRLAAAAHLFAEQLETNKRLILEQEDFDKMLAEWRKALKPFFPPDEFNAMFAAWERAFKPEYQTYKRAVREARAYEKSTGQTG